MRKIRDRPSEIAAAYTLSAQSIAPLADQVLIETNREPGSIGGTLILPPQYQQHYPTTGWVRAIGSSVSELSPGDFIILEEQGADIELSYYDVFEIILRHDDGTIEIIWAEIETEPVILEQVMKYRHTKEDRWIEVMDKKTKEGIGFHASNVVSWQMGQMANPTQELFYAPVFMIVLREGLHYMTRERNIIAKLQY